MAGDRRAARIGSLLRNPEHEVLPKQLIGGVIVYFDGSHLTATFSRTLGQVIADRV